MRVSGYERKTDSPKLGPSILIATALIVAIRTAKWAAKSTGDAHLSDVDPKLDEEVSFAARISIRVMHELLRKHSSLFPQRADPIYEAGSEDDILRSGVILERSLRFRYLPLVRLSMRERSVWRFLIAITSIDDLKHSDRNRQLSAVSEPHQYFAAKIDILLNEQFGNKFAGNLGKVDSAF